MALRFADSGLGLFRVNPGRMLSFDGLDQYFFDLFDDDAAVGVHVNVLLDFLRSRGVNIPDNVKMDYAAGGRHKSADIYHLVENYLAPFIWQKYNSILWESNGGWALVLRHEKQADLVEFFSPIEADGSARYRDPRYH